jgi:hypothetical protein
MARTNTGRWVTRAGATGGGRTYRGQVPVNWYLALVIIVVLGFLSVVLARYEYRHPKSTTVHPTVGETLYAAYGINICGKTLAALPETPNAASFGLTTPGDGLIQVSPTNAAEAGNNATLGLFVRSYKGLALSTTKITVPGSGTYHNGEACPSGTPDAGQKGQVRVETWPNSEVKTGTVQSDPTAYKIEARSLITMGFVPASHSLPQPPSSAIAIMLQASASVVNGTTTTTTTTTTPSSTTTTPSSTTTTPSSTTTTAP